MSRSGVPSTRESAQQSDAPSGNSTRESLWTGTFVSGKENAYGSEKPQAQERLLPDPGTPDSPDTPVRSSVLWPLSTRRSDFPQPLGRHLHRHSSIPSTLFPLACAERMRHVSFDSSVFALKHTFRGHCNTVTQGAFLSADTVISSSADYTVKLWNSGKPAASCLAHKCRVAGLSVVSPQTVATFASDCCALWDVQPHSLQKRRKLLTRCTTAICSPSPFTLLLGKANGGAGLWSLETSQETTVYGGHSAAVTVTVALGTGFLTGSRDMMVKMWDFRRSQCVATLQGHSDDVTAVVQWDDYSFLSASLDCTVTVPPTQKWDLRTFTPVSSFRSHEPVHCLEKVHNCIVTGGRALTLWKDHEKTSIAPHSATITSLKFAHGVLLTTAGDGLMTVRFIQTLRPTF